MSSITTSVNKTKTDVVFNNIIILGSYTTSVLSQKRRGEEKSTSIGFPKPTWVFSSPRRFWDKPDMVQLLKIIILLNTTSVLFFLTDAVSSITTSEIKPTYDSTSPESTSGQKPTKKAS